MKIDKFLLKGYPNGDAPQKRFLVTFSSLNTLRNLPDCQVIDLLDCQEEADEHHEIKTRRVTVDGNQQFFKVEKTMDFGKVTKEVETPITEEQFNQSVDSMYHLYKLVHRTRFAFCNGLISSGKLAGLDIDSHIGRGMFMMFDTFEFWNGFGILTIRGSEAKDIDTLKLPGGLEVVKEITRDKNFTTKVLATIDCTSFLE